MQSTTTHRPAKRPAFLGAPVRAVALAPAQGFVLGTGVSTALWGTAIAALLRVIA